jgi:hypothetical protein
MVTRMGLQRFEVNTKTSVTVHRVCVKIKLQASGTKKYMTHNSDFKYKCTSELFPRKQVNQKKKTETISRKVCLFLEHLPYFTTDISLHGEER